MFYEKFLDLCRQKGVSKTAACVNAGLSENTWKRWERGSVPNSITMGRLCDYFGVSIKSMYDDSETVQIVEDGNLRARQEAFDRAEMRVLFDAARDVPASKIYEVVAMLEKYKEESKGR